MKTSFFLGLLFTATSVSALRGSETLAQRQTDYYGADFPTRALAKDDLSKLISQRHQSVGYPKARKILFGEMFLKTDERGNYVEDVYCGKKFYFKDVRDISGMANQVNIEHTWPQSKFTRKFGKEMQKSDLHHLYPTDSAANNKRANFNFGDVDEAHDRLKLEDCMVSRLGRPNGSMIFSPPAENRGNIARSLFYFSTRYQVHIPQDEEATLREWHKADPVDEGERERHEIVVKHQIVRNPFVDYPELVERISDF